MRRLDLWLAIVPFASVPLFLTTLLVTSNSAIACSPVVRASNWQPQEDEVQEVQEESQDKTSKPEKYVFEVQQAADCTAVKSQDSTGTCWSFATTSFLEAELIRLGRREFNLSEMFIVKNIYREKAMNYVLRQGKANFGEGALAHDYINAVARYGVVPEEVFSGKLTPDKPHNHGEMTALLQSILETVVKRKSPSPRWRLAYDAILDAYLGTAPEKFQVGDREFTAMSFAQSMDFDANDYVNITSYTHHPFYESFVLEIPDNFSNGSFQNLPIDELIEIIDYAVDNGYTVAWDGDVSESTFSASRGIAVLPTDESRGTAMKKPGPEIEVTQEMRQTTFESFATTDDHLMHLVGVATDQTGKRYYMIKNSWGEVGPYDGYVHMSQAYARLKTVSILVHKNAIPPHLRR